VFLDTPGLLDPTDPLQEAMMESALGTLEGVDLVYWLVDHEEASGREREVLDRLQSGGPPVLLVLTKADQVPRPKMETREARWRESARWAGVHRISAATGEGLDGLLAATVERLPEQPFFYPEDELTDLPIRFIAAELIREACYEELAAEVPYSVHVAVEEWQDPLAPGEKTVIRAVIYVERESQKGIVIGEGGSRLKSIGTRARHSIEALVGGPVYLTLWVKVRKKWSRREADLKQFGYRR
jgi:GTP-binding protein Era